METLVIHLIQMVMKITHLLLEADLDVDCDSDGTFSDQSVAKKSYKIRVKKYSAPQLSDINMHEWSGKGITQDRNNYESRGTRRLMVDLFMM